MRIVALAGMLSLAPLIVEAQGLRTPNGELWAGTTLNLRARATTSTGAPIALSNEATVRVGQVVRWRMEHESSPFLTTSGEGWFTLKLTNRGNGVDRLSLSQSVWEGPETTPWRIDLYEQLTPEGTFTNGSLVGNLTNPFAPGEMRRLFIRVRPPSNRNTDGIWLSLTGHSVQDASVRMHRDFIAGVEAQVGAATSTTSWTNYPLLTAPQLVDGRLWWIVGSGTDCRAFFTPQPLRTHGTFSGNTQVGAKIINFTPAGPGAVLGTRWYLTAANGRIGFFEMSLLERTGSLVPAWVPLPAGTLANSNVPLVTDGVLLYFADMQNRLGMFNPTNWALTFYDTVGTQIITHLYALPDRTVVVCLSSGSFYVLRKGVLIRQVNSVPGAGSAPIVGVDLEPHSSLLFVGAGTRVGCLDLLTGQWLWVQNLNVPLASAPVYNLSTQTCYGLTTDGQLHALNAYTGLPSLFYPQFVVDGLVTQAKIAVARQEKRKISYVYLVAQTTDGTSHVRMVTAFNPFNRFTSTSIPVGATLGSFWLQTGEEPNDFMIAWCSNGAGGVRGGFYAYRLR